MSRPVPAIKRITNQGADELAASGSSTSVMIGSDRSPAKLVIAMNDATVVVNTNFFMLLPFSLDR